MSEKNLNPTYNEDIPARETAGATQNQPTQPPGAAGDGARSPWDKLLAKLRSVRLVKSAKKLRDLRDLANAWYPVLGGEREAIEAKLDSATDPLDQAALKEELETCDAKVGKLNDGLTAISNRAKVLVGDA